MTVYCTNGEEYDYPFCRGRVRGDVLEVVHDEYMREEVVAYHVLVNVKRWVP